MTAFRMMEGGSGCEPPSSQTDVIPLRMISLLCSRMFWNNNRVNRDTSKYKRQARFSGMLPARGTDQLAWLIDERCYLSCQFSCQASHLYLRMCPLVPEICICSWNSFKGHSPWNQGPWRRKMAFSLSREEASPWMPPLDILEPVSLVS